MNIDEFEGHTEGPWKWAEHTGENQLWGVREPTQVHGAFDSLESIVINDGWADCLNCGSIKNSLWDYTSPEDMKLIAAAPDLLAFYLRVKEIMDMEEIEEIVRVELIWTVMQEMKE